MRSFHRFDLLSMRMRLPIPGEQAELDRAGFAALADDPQTPEAAVTVAAGRDQTCLTGGERAHAAGGAGRKHHRASLSRSRIWRQTVQTRTSWPADHAFGPIGRDVSSRQACSDSIRASLRRISLRVKGFIAVLQTPASTTPRTTPPPWPTRTQ